jgi:hypothetical protein
MRKVERDQREKDGARRETYHGSGTHFLGQGRLTAKSTSKTFGRGMLLLVINNEQHSTRVIVGNNLQPAANIPLPESGTNAPRSSSDMPAPEPGWEDNATAGAEPESSTNVVTSVSPPPVRLVALSLVGNPGVKPLTLGFGGREDSRGRCSHNQFLRRRCRWVRLSNSCM